jgi:hypothetical protein
MTGAECQKIRYNLQYLLNDAGNYTWLSQWPFKLVEVVCPGGCMFAELRKTANSPTKPTSQEID